MKRKGIIPVHFAAVALLCALSLTEQVDAQSSAGGAAAVRTLVAGQTFPGELTASDPRLADGAHYELWRFRGQAGQRFTIVMMSGGFDPSMQYGRMNGGEFTSLGRSTPTPAGFGEDAVIELTLPSSGEYGIRATSMGPHTGDYMISAIVTGSLAINQTASATLTSSDNQNEQGAHFDIYRISGQAGQRLHLSLRSSAFDPYMEVGRIESGVFISLLMGMMSDDHVSGAPVTMDIRFPFTGELAIKVNSYSKSLGDYSLMARAAAQ